MKLPRDLSGKDLAACLCRAQGLRAGASGRQPYHPANQNTFAPSNCDPAHDSLRIGTLNAILRDVARHKATDRQVILDTL